jgi:hypothetical protein
MTAKEKAKELVENFTFNCRECDNAKQCALRAVDEIIKSEPRNPSDIDWDDVGGTHQYYYEAQREEALKYWQEVKEEINKI